MYFIFRRNTGLACRLQSATGMKRLFLFLFIFCLTAQAGFSQLFRHIENNSFQKGEKLTFRIHYGWMDAGEATMEVEEKEYYHEGRKVYHIIGKGYTTGAFDWFFKVRDTYETYIDEEALIPWVFLRDVDEGGYLTKHKQIFNHRAQKVIVTDYVKNKVSTHDIPMNIQDLLSAYYYARCLNYQNIKPGDTVEVVTFFDHEIFPLKVQFAGRETLATSLGKIPCLKFHPMLQTGRIFKTQQDMAVWFSDDNNHIPVRAEAKILVGSIRADLKKAEGLKYELTKVK